MLLLCAFTTFLCQRQTERDVPSSCDLPACALLSTAVKIITGAVAKGATAEKCIFQVTSALGSVQVDKYEK